MLFLNNLLKNRKRQSQKYKSSLIDVEIGQHDDKHSGTFIERVLDTTITEILLDLLSEPNHDDAISFNLSKDHIKSPRSSRLLDQTLSITGASLFFGVDG